jgi:uncharacterized protein
MTVSDSTAKHRGFLGRSRWNPYVVGAAIGVLSWVVFAVVAKPLGVTTAVSQCSAAVAEPFMGEDGLKANAYFKSHMPKLDYGTLFLLGTFVGAGASALVSRSFRIEVVPEVWRERYGSSGVKRLAVAFVGGLVAMYGARMAGGCTSGNGLSGSMQLAVSGWTFFMTMFASGLVTAWLMFRKSKASS